MGVLGVGAVCFGIVVGWVTSRTLRRSTPSGLTDIATVVGSVGGAAITDCLSRATTPSACTASGSQADSFFT
jgi:hypothetical protein